MTFRPPPKQEQRALAATREYQKALRKAKMARRAAERAAKKINKTQRRKA